MADTIISAIDVGSSKTAVICAKLSDLEDNPRIMGFSSVASKGVRRGQIVDINQVTDTLEEAVEKAERMAGSKIDSALVSIGGPHIESINSAGVVAISQPDVEISQADVERAVDAARAISLSSSREVIEVVPREYIVDGQGGIKNPLGMSGVRLEVSTHIITASNTNLKNLDRALSDLGIVVNGYVFSGLASSMSTLSETERELGVVVVDIGGGKCDICIYVDGSLSYSCSIPMGARHITNDIAVGLRLSLDSAEKIKILLSDKSAQKKVPAEKKPFSAKDDLDVSDLHLPEGITTVSYKTLVDGIIRPRVSEIFELVRDEIHKSGFSGNIPSGLVITGGGAMTVSVAEIAKKIVGANTRIGIPTNVSGLVDEVLFPQFACLCGLIIYSKNYSVKEQKMNMKDFDKIFKNIPIKSSIKKITDLFKSFIP